MLQGDAIREITLEGPGAGGIETASAVVADLVSVVGTAGTGFLQNDACWRELERLPPREWRTPFYVRLEVADRPGVLAQAASRLAAHGVSVAQLVQRLHDGEASLDLVLHEASVGQLMEALREIAAFPEVLRPPFVLPVITEGRL
jgi:homoserine dehydrogenase